MDGLLRSVGDGISGLVGGAIGAIGAALRGMVTAADRALPGGILFVVVVALIVLAGVVIIRR